jgi:hypothetical protein
MTGPGRKWEERRRLLASRKPKVRVDSAVVRTGKGGKYEVIIEGFGLRPAISPPQILVGGVLLEEATFARDGRTVTGVLRHRPKNQQVLVDLGYASAEGKLAVE